MTSFMKEFEHLKIQLEEIETATNSFSNKVIGADGFGAVYEGEISHSTGRSIVAMKRLNRQFGQGDSEFLKEIMLLSQFTHQNLVSLLGFCDEEEKVLIYEFASKGSLDRHLSDPNLKWVERIKICLGAAKGPSYLHDPKGRNQRVIHCDIKSANILLDETLTAKVADFGLSKMGPANQQYSVLVTKGTQRYCDPLFMTTSTLTKESDVYSFGVVLFEVLSGRLCYEYSNGRQVKLHDKARDITEKVHFGKKRPPSLDEVSLHPFLRSSKKHIQFCMDATARNLRNEMQKVWKSGVPLEIEDSPLETKANFMDLVSNMKKLRFLHVRTFGNFFEDYLPSILDLPEEVSDCTKSTFKIITKRHLLDLSIEFLTMGLLSDILSLTSPVDVCRAAVVSKIFKAVADSDYVWHKFLPLDLHEIIARAVSNVVFHSQKELYFLLSDSYILLDRGTLGFKLDKESGKKCYMLAARHLSIAWHDDKRYWEWGHIPESRFAEVGMLREVWWLDIHGIIATAMLSPKTMYEAYLVFLTTRWSSGLNVPAKTIVTVGGIRNETSNVYLQRPGTTAQPQVSHTMRKDGWIEIPLGEFYCDDGDEGEVEMVFEEHVYWKAGLIVEGIEVRPK